MKTFRLIGLAVMAIMVSVNLSSCSKDDDPTKNDDGIVIGEKKLVQMILVNEEVGYYSTKTYDFEYDSKDRLISITITAVPNEFNNYPKRINYIWANNIIIEQDGDYTNTYNIEGDLVNTIKESYGNDETELVSFSYNSKKQLTALKSTYIDDGDTYTEYYTWNNERLVLCDDIEFTYSGKTCKGYIPFDFMDIGLEYYDLFVAHPELAGVRTSQLPDKKIYDDGDIVEYSYAFDKDGYLESYTDKYGDWIGVCKFKWE